MVRHRGFFLLTAFTRNHTEKHRQDRKRHAGISITRKVVNSRSSNALCFSVFRVFPWLK